MKKNTFLMIYGCYIVGGLLGCARFSTTQTDISYEEGKPARTITTRVKASTFWEAKSALSTFAASQTDKTQSAKVGGLNHEASSTNAVRSLELLRDIAQALPK